MCLPGSWSRQGWGLTDWSSDKMVMVERSRGGVGGGGGEGGVEGQREKYRGEKWRFR